MHQWLFDPRKIRLLELPDKYAPCSPQRSTKPDTFPLARKIEDGQKASLHWIDMDWQGTVLAEHQYPLDMGEEPGYVPGTDLFLMARTPPISPWQSELWRWSEQRPWLRRLPLFPVHATRVVDVRNNANLLRISSTDPRPVLLKPLHLDDDKVCLLKFTMEANLLTQLKMYSVPIPTWLQRWLPWLAPPLATLSIFCCCLLLIRRLRRPLRL